MLADLDKSLISNFEIMFWSFITSLSWFFGDHPNKIKLLITLFISSLAILLFISDLKVKDRLVYYTLEQFSNGENLLIYGTYPNLNSAFTFGPKNENEVKAFSVFNDLIGDISEFTQSWTRVLIKSYE